MSPRSERRRFRRVPERYVARVQELAPDPHDDDRVGVSRDLSATGALLELPFPLEVGSVLEVSFSGSRAVELFHAWARVVRETPSPRAHRFEIGLEFLDLFGENEQDLDDFLTRS
jgi:c-di-GMP-binding flagellar brake protein YcgR